ncbi:glycosyltransferase involved in cell wall biosynthesis [Umezawaea tangerina]|uniref:Glycosyltransferase involved in cell wall biosynthesis n=2 Tax=Umezawaea tangerina TaxID=84725 RepID=A0A2T0STI7_9PSEU|nr:glycosyltransferase involved in cell wall biosynthesis [Umezawaea tangerina]
MVAASWDLDADEDRAYVAELCSVLSRDDHDVVLYTRRDSPGPRERRRTPHGYEIVRVSAGSDTGDEAVDGFASFLEREWDERPPDVAHPHGRASGLAVGAGRVPVVQTFHHSAGSRISRPTPLDRSVCASADRVIAMSRWEQVKLLHMGVRKPKSAVVPRGIDTALFHPDGPVAPRGHRTRVLALGDVVPTSGFHTAISALRWAPGAELVIAGRIRHPAPMEDVEVRRLVELADRAGVGDRVRFTGRVTRARLPRLIRSADVVLRVPRFDPYGSAAVQAMACGVPVIAADVGALADVVVDGVTGVLVPPHDPRALGHVLRDLLADATRRQIHAIAGRDRACARYSWERVLPEHLAVYQDAITGSQAVSSRS